MQLGQEHFARGIDRRLQSVTTKKTIPAYRTATAHALAGAPLSLLIWCMDHDMPITPEQAEEPFHRMIAREADDPEPK
jgi:hypothetical protein